MTDFYINTGTLEAFEKLQGKVPFDYGQGGTIGSVGWDIDVIGGDELKTTGWTKDGDPIQEPMGGYLINLRSDNEIPFGVKDYLVYPKTPIRVWA